MNNSNLTEFKNDFNNLLRCEDIMEKYKISKTTYHTIVRKLGLKRPKTSKILRTFNMSFADDDNKSKETENKQKSSHIPIDNIYKKVDESDEKLVYEKQYVPRNTTINVEKQKTTTNKPKAKPVIKEQIVEPKNDESNNKSELLNAINKSTKVREKLLNKKNNS